MTRWNPPQLICKSLPDFDPTDAEDVRRAFEGAASCNFGQGWLEESQPRWRPAVARVGWRAQSLCVYAEMTDDDIYNHATEPNQDTWRLGDVFEIFVRPLPQQVWFELHVTPENQTLQLHFPGSAETYTQVVEERGYDLFLMPEPIFASRTWVLPAQMWRVLAEIPAASVAESMHIQAGDEWLFSFCRYDYTWGESEPVLSSTSPYAICKFDRQQEWGRLHFVA